MGLGTQHSNAKQTDNANQPPAPTREGAAGTAPPKGRLQHPQGAWLSGKVRPRGVRLSAVSKGSGSPPDHTARCSPRARHGAPACGKQLRCCGHACKAASGTEGSSPHFPDKPGVFQFTQLTPTGPGETGHTLHFPAGLCDNSLRSPGAPSHSAQTAGLLQSRACGLGGAHGEVRGCARTLTS